MLFVACHRLGAKQPLFDRRILRFRLAVRADCSSHRHLRRRRRHDRAGQSGLCGACHPLRESTLAFGALILLIREEGLKSSAGLRKLRLFQQSHTRLLGFRQDEATRIGGGGNEIARLRAEAKSLQRNQRAS